MTGVEYVHEVLIPLCVATVLGGILGFERETQGQWAGLRTHLLVALGSATLLRVGVLVTSTHPAELSRVVQGIATGVGFIGAGTILKRESSEEVQGLTTASSIWTAAAIGVAASLKMYALAVTGTVLALLVLQVIRRVEHWIGAPVFPKKGDPKETEK